MKTTFRPRNSAQSKRFGLVLGAVVLSLLIFVFLRSYVVAVVAPIWRSENAVSTSFRNTVNMVRDKNALVRENEALKERLASFETLLASYRTLESSQERLLRTFGRSGSVPGIAAGVLVHPPETPYDILIVDAGESEGVSQGSKVSLPEGGALGVVREVLWQESKVALYSGSGEETQAVLERGGVAVTLSGRGGGTFEIELPREVPVAVGDKVLMPGLRAELVGVVEDISVEPTDSVQHVLVRGVANIRSIRFVTIRP